MNQKPMSRKEYTRHQIKEGLLYALTQDSFDTLTISKVSQLAGITRATFYLHYANLTETLSDLLDDAISAAGPTDNHQNNLLIINQTLQAASTIEELRQAYDSIFHKLPLCQRVSADTKYIPLFKDTTLSEYIIHNLYYKEQSVQVQNIATQLNIPTAIATSIFLFCVHGLYAINQQYNWQRSDDWLKAQKALFQFMTKGLTSLKNFTF
ncbi:TetR/AcrR family transcriptional regulator [Veillonella criceti]|uniref:HTH tetR-type domain-containing protein n=1 Tax=Veillonella criceti TaxID=103891 RepID=A0A380NLR0_9FIRM|nr:TetR/AcrR family transcriptional regulator [Veillonella criceti]SUP43726.1 Uncharacterised protein [Veillonella criceti]